jgi:hypothetical protein
MTTAEREATHPSLSPCPPGSTDPGPEGTPYAGGRVDRVLVAREFAGWLQDVGARDEAQREPLTLEGP